jgi:amino-acid N-acetyltransferase
MLLMQVERATEADAAAVEGLLTDANLPLDGAADALVLGVVARADDRVVAAAAVERFGEHGLLRSVVVANDRRGTGLGRRIVAAAEALAREDGATDLYLLTETAIDWFPRLGYEVVDRSVAAGAVGDSIEFTTVCRDTGVPMRRSLRQARRGGEGGSD